jgi:hypothetical protein
MIRLKGMTINDDDLRAGEEVSLGRLVFHRRATVRCTVRYGLLASKGESRGG